MATRFQVSLYESALRVHQYRNLATNCLQHSDYGTVDVALLGDLLDALERAFTEFVHTGAISNATLTVGKGLIRSCRDEWTEWTPISAKLSQCEVDCREYEKSLDGLEQLLNAEAEKSGNDRWVELGFQVVEGTHEDLAENLDALELTPSQIEPDNVANDDDSQRVTYPAHGYEDWQRIENGLVCLRKLVSDPAPREDTAAPASPGVSKVGNESTNREWEEGYLDLLFNDTEKQVKSREANVRPVQLSTLRWRLLRAFCDGGDNPQELADLDTIWATLDRPKTKVSSRRGEINALSQQLKKLGVGIVSQGRGRGWKLVRIGAPPA